MALSLCPMPSGYICPHNPLWFNPSLSEFMSIPDPSVWALMVIKNVDQICAGGQLQNFDGLKQKYNLPNAYLFRFLQLRHPFNIKFENSQVAFYTSTLEHLSNIYKELLTNIHMGPETLKAKWVEDFPTLDMEDWEEELEFSFTHLLSTRDRLIQFKIMHRVYFTPTRLHKIYPSISASCWRCVVCFYSCILDLYLNKDFLEGGYYSYFHCHHHPDPTNGGSVLDGSCRPSGS